MVIIIGGVNRASECASLNKSQNAQKTRLINFLQLGLARWLQVGAKFWGGSQNARFLCLRIRTFLGCHRRCAHFPNEILGWVLHCVCSRPDRFPVSLTGFWVEWLIFTKQSGTSFYCPTTPVTYLQGVGVGTWVPCF